VTYSESFGTPSVLLTLVLLEVVDSMQKRAVPSFRAIVVGLAACVPLMMLVLGGSPRAAEAKDKMLEECKPDGLPTTLMIAGPVEATHAIERDGGAWLVSVDSATRPDKISMFEAKGDAIQLAKLPSSVELRRFVARGQAVYGVGLARSQVQRSTNIVAARWGQDARARVTMLWPGDAVDAKPEAALTREYMAVVWGQRAADGKSHVMLGIVDLEQTLAGTTRDLGVRKPDGFLDVVAADDGFVAVWAGEQGVARLAFDAHGKSRGAVSVQRFEDSGALRGAIVCSGRTWLLRDASADQLAVWSLDQAGHASEATRLPASPKLEHTPMICVGDGVAVAHRTLVSGKDSSVVLWLSNVDASGHLRERRVRDIHGGIDDIRAFQLSRVGDATRAWWLEGQGSAVKLWSRAIACR
jgi:hypothetical protein